MMDDIHIKRYSNDPQVKGCIEPENGSWQLLVDHDGTPHLLLRCQVENDAGQVVPGWVALDDLLPDGVEVQDIQRSVFSGEPTSEDLDGVSSKAPCPK